MRRIEGRIVFNSQYCVGNEWNFVKNGEGERKIDDNVMAGNEGYESCIARTKRAGNHEK